MVYIIFLILLKKHRLWVLVRTASPRRFKRVPTIYVLSRNIYVLSRNMKNIRNFLSENFPFLVVKFSIYMNRHVFVMHQLSVFTVKSTESFIPYHLPPSSHNHYHPTFAATFACRDHKDFKPVYWSQYFYYRLKGHQRQKPLFFLHKNKACLPI